jgi:predicted amidohydrolase YtcJ
MTEQADLALVNGNVYTVNAARDWAQAVAIRAGRIAAVGLDRQVRELIGPSTEVVDLKGRMVLPGFQDSHMHPVGGGMELLRCDLQAGQSEDEYITILSDYARSHPGGGWILGGGWTRGAFGPEGPNCASLDRAAPDRPVLLFDADHRGSVAWANSRALDLGRVDSRTPDPSHGHIDRDPSGTATGVLEDRAIDVLLRAVPDPTAADLTDGLRSAEQFLHALGITAWHDAGMGAWFNGMSVYEIGHDVYDTYRSAAERGDLTMRISGAFWWERRSDENQIEDFLRRKVNVGRFRATTVKILQDGGCEARTAAMRTPYLDRDGRQTENTGISWIDSAELKHIAARLDAEGFQLHIHANGDRGIFEALNAIEAARAQNGPSDQRHLLAHVQVLHPSDLPRFRELGVSASMQPLWSHYERKMIEPVLQNLGGERGGWQYRIGSLIRSGATVGFGTDWPWTSADPLWGIRVATTRRAPRDYEPENVKGHDETFLPDERISLPEAIASYTIGAAVINHLDAETGSVEVGKLADLVVVDRNLFAHPLEEVDQARVLLTLSEGQAVYESKDL